MHVRRWQRAICVCLISIISFQRDRKVFLQSVARGVQQTEGGRRKGLVESRRLETFAFDFTRAEGAGENIPIQISPASYD